MTDISLEAIEKVLDEKVRPDLALHGGNIGVEDLRAGVLYVRLLGACSGCLSADMTMETLVAGELKETFPELKEVSLVTGVSDSLIAEAKDFLNKRHESRETKK